MVAVEVVLIMVGVIFLVGSFFLTERLSQKDLEQITLISEADLKHIAEKQVKSVKARVEDAVEEVIEESLEITKRGLEKETNNKIMAVSEYSDTVMEKMNNTHNEIIFLYSMLNEKHSETAELVGNMQKYAKQIRETEIPSQSEIPKAPAEVQSVQPLKMDVEENVQNDVELSKNERILLLYMEGMDEVQIAKTLNCGLGEVRLVLGLYHET